MAVGDKPTSFDIAALAGVSQPTVSRALRGDRSVSAATRLRIEAIARQLNYKVDKNASALRRGSTSTLALLFFDDPAPDGSRINPFFLSMLGSILHTCGARGYDLLTSFQQLSADWHVDYEDSRKADGLILLGYGDFDDYSRRLDQLVAQGTHFVRWGSPDPAHPGSVVGCDNIAGGRDAGAHLLARGRRRIAFLGDASSQYPESRDRYRGLASALREAGLAIDPGLQVDALSSEASGYDAARRLIARDITFDAIFAASDMIALGAVRALGEAGRTVPGDVAIVGFDDIPAASLAQPPLTTIRQDYARAGELLVDMLIRRVARRETEPVLLRPDLVVRKSS
ncbi:LacI family transcriptional regulator [Sphingomonas sp. Leaf407]|uniref:LacI family DNA-binding transcriptional regulator n=1 Tax=unclassified Sphingomonas TaxID=196159 RepID=UPI0006F35E99|nr:MULTISPECIES: LacI family DNA-binding transcriptional regulator [unclassified Sphingomonas]KQN37063.1 LacI family transcriptional regulator [Sphingomonas sp. Leaf42]KQT30490.1 LacI family transcriptional regulator [Sphingomonas sp. Leaf407]